MDDCLPMDKVSVHEEAERSNLQVSGAVHAEILKPCKQMRSTNIISV
jgi:hypothetical protein